MSTSGVVRGLDRLQVAFRRAVDLLHTKGATKAVSAGSKVLMDAYKSVTPIGETEQLYKSVARKIRKTKEGARGKSGYNVGRKKKDRRYAPHSTLIHGTKWRTTGKTGKRKKAFRGRVDPNDRVKRGVVRSISTAIRAVENEIKRQLAQVRP